MRDDDGWWRCGYCPKKKFATPRGAAVHIGKQHKKKPGSLSEWNALFPAVISRRVAGLRHAAGLRIAETYREGA